MTENNGWPGKPGVPFNPEKDGWHWLKRISNGWETLAKWDNDWNGNDDFWWNLPGYSDPEKVAKVFCYLGPCLTPDEATALQARADRNAAGFARVDAEAERDKFLHKQEIAALQKRVAELEGAVIQCRSLTKFLKPQADRIAELETALKAAAEDIGDWGAYASQYLQEKWDLAGEVKRYTAIAEGKLPYRSRSSMGEPEDE